MVIIVVQPNNRKQHSTISLKNMLIEKLGLMPSFISTPLAKQTIPEIFKAMFVQASLSEFASAARIREGSHAHASA